MKLPVIFAVNGADAIPEDLFRRFMNVVSAERRSKVEKFYRREDACRSLLAESLIRYIFFNAGLQDYGEIRLTRNEFGKPESILDGFHFNVSHSGSWVVCAADIEEIGIDVERIHKVDRGISRRFFSSVENKLLSDLESPVQWQDCFFKIWVLKESYIKAIGKGLNCPLNSFAVLPQNENTACLIRYEEALPQKYFKIYHIDPAYKCALCCSHQNFPKKVHIVSAQEIIVKLEGASTKGTGSPEYY